MRSRTGCMTCRQRKLKCDETKPLCGQCYKASRTCIPSSGIVFRHQHNASMNGDDSGDENLKGFYAYKNTFDEDTVWLDIPKNVTFIHTSNPYLDPLTPDFDTMSVTSMDSPAPFDSRPSFTSWPTSSPSSSGPESYPRIPRSTAPVAFRMPSFNRLGEPTTMYSPPVSTTDSPSPSLAFSSPMPFSPQHIPSMMDRLPMTPPAVDPRLSLPLEPLRELSTRPTSDPRRTVSMPSVDPSMGQDHELAFLMRYFSEGPGYWMDLFDLGTYFASDVPVKARNNPMLKYAAAAYAAKALGRVQGKKPVMGGSVTRQARMELYPDAATVDWYHKAAQYYDTAVSLLLQALKDDSAMNSDVESDPELRRNGGASLREASGRATKRQKISANCTPTCSTDELVAASAILCVYEFLDASVPEWAKHLNGAKSLLVIAQERMMPLQMRLPGGNPSTGSSGFITKARRATFWNIARQDMLAAFINKTHTRLDTEDLSLWQEAGLQFDGEGFIATSNTTESGYPEDGMMKEDLICNALVWLAAKLINFMASGDELPAECGGPFAGVPQRTLLDYWYHLQRHFQKWYDGLPVTFHPSARLEPSRIPSQLLHNDEDLSFPEIWYSIPMCASTMQTYHMSQIQLLMNKPHESTQGRTTVLERLKSYHDVVTTCQAHSREIVGISLARSDEAVRIHSVQPLFTAGECLRDPKERQVVQNLLCDIQTDTGWATEYRVQQLAQQWQLEAEEQSRFT